MDSKLDRHLVILDSFSAKTENDISKEFIGVAAQKNGQFTSGEQVPASAPCLFKGGRNTLIFTTPQNTLQKDVSEARCCCKNTLSPNLFKFKMNAEGYGWLN